jgi:hypothetical protein
MLVGMKSPPPPSNVLFTLYNAKLYMYFVGIKLFLKYLTVYQLWMSIARGAVCFWSDYFKRGLINFIDTEAKCRHLKN